MFKEAKMLWRHLCLNDLTWIRETKKKSHNLPGFCKYLATVGDKKSHLTPKWPPHPEIFLVRIQNKMRAYAINDLNNQTNGGKSFDSLL